MPQQTMSDLAPRRAGLFSTRKTLTVSRPIARINSPPKLTDKDYDTANLVSQWAITG